jgi:hypothetical protein
MSAPSRCHECKHKRGPRRMYTRQNPGRGGKGIVGTVKKKHCSCECHG